jgi:hypothetical protein
MIPPAFWIVWYSGAARQLHRCTSCAAALHIQAGSLIHYLPSTQLQDSDSSVWDVEIRPSLAVGTAQFLIQYLATTSLGEVFAGKKDLSWKVIQGHSKITFAWAYFYLAAINIHTSVTEILPRNGVQRKDRFTRTEILPRNGANMKHLGRYMSINEVLPSQEWCVAI